MGDDLETKKFGIDTKLKLFFSNKYNLILIGILVFAFILRLKYFNINSAVWWDEAEYLVKAKEMVFGTPATIWNPGRSIIFSLFLAPFFKLGLSEAAIRFFTELIPSMIAVWLTYLVGKEIYGKRVGLIAAFISSVFWLNLFLMARFLTEIFGLVLALVAILFFWKVYVKDKNPKYLWIVWIAITLMFLTRFSDVILIFVLFVFLLLVKRFSFFKEKHFWIGFLINFTVVVLPYSIWNLVKFGYIPFIKFYVTGGDNAFTQFTEPAWYGFSYFREFLANAWFIVFFIGLITFFSLILAFDLIVKRKEKKYTNDLFLLLIIIFYLVFFVFFYKYIEHRYVLILGVAMFLIVAKGLMTIYHYVKKHSAILALFLVLAILGIGAYEQIQYGNNLIMNKKDSYVHLRLAGEWIKERTEPGDKVSSISECMQIEYYSERVCLGYESTIEKNEETIRREKPKYLVEHIWYNSPQFEWQFPQKHNLEPLMAWFLDEEQTQPAAVIYSLDNFE